jgi:hypothetical protein
VAEALDEGAALADGRGEVLDVHFGEVLRHALHDAEGVVAAAVEDDEDLKGAGVVGAEIGGVVAEGRLDALLLVVGGNQEENAGFRTGHGRWG